MSRKLWHIASFDKNQAAALAYEYGYDEFAVLLLSARGLCAPEEVGEFLDGDAELFDPFLIKDMDKAADRVTAAVENNEKIVVYGDYDADGVTATALLYMYLEAMGADVSCYIPSRTQEGYGLHESAIDKLAAEGVQLIITVDNGINAVHEASYIKSKGIDLIITDHHQPGDMLPDAVAVVDPHRADDTCPFKDLAGVGVAYKLAAAIEGGDCDGILQDFSDIIAIGTVADIVPLKGENRTLVIRGVEAVRNMPRPGLAALKTVAGCGEKAFTSMNIAFALAPRINAAGRISAAETALKLLLAEDEKEAAALAEQLDAFNQQRQETEADIVEEAVAQIENDPQLKYAKVLVVDGDGWHAGVIGIVASKLVDRYGKPAMVIAKDGSGDAKGSCRSIDGFSLFDALTAVKDSLVRFGGHTLAAGFTVREDRIDEFRHRINEYAQTLPVFAPTLKLDCKLNPAAITIDLIDSLSLLEPFGAENPQPIFGLYGVTLLSVKSLGATGKHIRITFEKKSNQYSAVYFGMTAEDFPYVQGDMIDMAVTVDKNEFRGEIKPNIYIKAVKSSLFNDSRYFSSEALYDRLKQGLPINEKERAFLCPDRNFAASVFRFIKKSGSSRIPPELMAIRLGYGSEVTCRLRVVLDAFCELNLLTYKNGVYTAANNSNKVSLGSSVLLKKLGYRE